MKMTIKTGDNVLVIAGKDKGKSGKVTAVYADKSKVLVEGINIVSKHQKARSQQEKSSIIKKSAPIDASNVQVICPVCGKATRVAHSEVAGKKVRSCKKCNGSLDKEFVKQSKKEAKKTIKAEELKGAKLKSAKTKTAEEKVEEKPVEKKTTAKKTTATAAAEKPATKATKTTKKVEEKVEEAQAKTPAKKSASTTKTSTTKAAEKTSTAKKTTAKTATKAEGEKTTTKKSTTAKKETK